MFASLGPVSFQVTNSPQRFVAKSESHYDVVPVINGTPASQWVYDGLETLRLEFLFSQQFTNPHKAIQALKALKAAHKAVPLVFANGQNEGNFVITSLEQTDVWRSNLGDIIAVQMVAELLEYGGTLPVGAPTSIPDTTPGLLNSDPIPLTEYSGTPLVPAQIQPDAVVGMPATILPAGTPLYPTIPKLPYTPSVGQGPGPTSSVSYLSVPLKLALRWGSGQ